MCDVYVFMLCHCYDMFYVCVIKDLGYSRLIKVTAHIRATLTKVKVNDPPWC